LYLSVEISPLQCIMGIVHISKFPFDWVFIVTIQFVVNIWATISLEQAPYHFQRAREP